MVEKKEKEVENTKDEATPEDQSVIRWDGSDMRSTYANVCNVTSTREEMTLLFGTNQSWHTGQKELVVQLSDRIVLNPYAAKRMSILLNNVVTEYEKRYGILDLEPALK